MAVAVIEEQATSVPIDQVIDEKTRLDVNNTEILKDDPAVLDTEIKAAHSSDDLEDSGSGSDSEDAIIVTGTDAAKHLLPLRDDGQPALTFRSIFLATVMSAFQAVMNQIY